MREQGMPIGRMDTTLSPEDAIKKIRNERLMWVSKNNTHNDSICKKNCLDVCIDYNNKVASLNKNVASLINSASSASLKKVIPIKQSCVVD